LDIDGDFFMEKKNPRAPASLKEIRRLVCRCKQGTGESPISKKNRSHTQEKLKVWGGVF